MRISNDFEKIGLRTNLSFFGDVEKIHAPYSHYSTGDWGTWSHIQNKKPWDLAYNDLGLFASGSDHPLVEISPDSGYNRRERRNINSQLDIEWKIPHVDGLTFKLVGNYRTFNFFRKQWQINADQYALGSDVPLGKNPPSLSYRSEEGYRYYVNPQLTYKKDFGEHNIKIMAGYDENYTHGEWIETSRENYILEVDQLFAGPTDTAKNNNEEFENAKAGYFGRVQYSFANKYFLSGSVRHDGNDNFPKDTRWGTFYSGSIGWVITEEKFVKPIRII